MAASTSSVMMGRTGAISKGLEAFLEWADPSLITSLDADPETAIHEPNQSSRRVKSGHYVLARPTPLPDPSLVIFSTHLARSLKLSDDDCRSPDFISFFSGNGTELLPLQS